MKKFGGLVLIVLGFGAMIFSALVGVIMVIAGLVITWSAESK